MFLLHLPGLLLCLSDCSLFISLSPVVLSSLCLSAQSHLLVIVSLAWPLALFIIAAHLLICCSLFISILSLLFCAVFAQSHLLVVAFAQLLPFSALAIDHYCSW